MGPIETGVLIRRSEWKGRRSEDVPVLAFKVEEWTELRNAGSL